MRLVDRLRAQIAAQGPLTVAQFMEACLHDPQDGYYATRPALGEAGDFITAPLVSQMFGELLGVWAISVWQAMGRPALFRLVEVGPGDGTLIRDLLRAGRLDPAFLSAAELWLVESSPVLRERQEAAIGASDFDHANWVPTLAQVSTGQPIILIANELLDCLPARQFVKTDKGWAERMVGLDAAGDLALGMTPSLLPGERPAPVGAILEVSPAQEAFAAEVAARLVADGGAALLIDYGRDAPGFGDTLQALRRHAPEPPLDNPGLADLTIHADFPAVLAAAQRQGASTVLATQQAFLRRLGIDARAAALSRVGTEAAALISRQLGRLVDDDQMGMLFKVACLYYPQGLAPPGFSDD